MRSTKKRTQNRIWVFLLALAALLVCACLLLHRLGAAPPALYEALSGGTGTESAPFDESGIPAYGGQDWVELNKNRPLFTKEELSAEAHVTFAPFDSLGRTGMGEAMLGPELLPTEERGPVGDFRPSGWHTARYDDLIEDRFLYNRCHVIGYLLCGDNSTPTAPKTMWPTASPRPTRVKTSSRPESGWRRTPSKTTVRACSFTCLSITFSPVSSSTTAPAKAAALRAEGGFSWLISLTIWTGAEI